MTRIALILAVVTPLAALAVEPDVGRFYEVSTEGSTTRLKAGDSGKVVIAIATRDGAHVSGEAPLRIELSSKHSQLEKKRLTLKDASATTPSPRFEVAFTPTTQGPTSVEAKLTFFICTDSLCARQTRTLSLPVSVE